MRHLAALLLAAILIGGCSTSPVSEVTASGTPAAQATVVPSTAAETPTAATPTPTSGASGEPSAPPVATPTPSPANAAPPKPADVTWTLVEQIPVKATGRTLERNRITWSSPDGVATGFIAYGVTSCLRNAKQFDNKPCVVKGMRIPKDQLVKLGTADGRARTMDISWELNEIGPGPYAAVLLRAVNAVGNSIFTIAWSENVCWKCVY